MNQNFYVFIVHKWRHPYLKYVIDEAIRYWNKIILLTDNKDLTKEYLKIYNNWKYITIENISDYFLYAKNFEKIYTHMSVNSFDFEKFCIDRWLIILEYIEKHNINTFWHIDSDVLLFCDLSKQFEKYWKCDFWYVWSCWHIFLWTKKWLNEFKHFIFDTYIKNIQLLKDYSQHKREIQYYDHNNVKLDWHNNWCVSDMTLFYLFKKSNNKNLIFQDIWRIKEGEVFDHNINSSEWFKYKLIKSITLSNNSYFGDLYWKKVKFKCLHFIWDAKYFIKYFHFRNIWFRLYISIWIHKVVIPRFLKILRYLGLYKFIAKIYWLYRKKKYWIIWNLNTK